MQAYVVRVAFRGKEYDDPAYAVLNERMAAAKFPLLQDAENQRPDAPRYSMVDYSFETPDGESEAGAVLKKAKAVANTVSEDNTVVVWEGYHEGGGQFSFEPMCFLTDDI